MKTINQWLDEYGVSHQNQSNKLIHFVCVPVIFFTIVGLLYCIKLPEIFGLQLTVAHIVLIGVVIYYFILSPLLAAGITVYTLLCMILCTFIEQSTGHLLMISLILFVLAWVAQFWGHHIEGKRPSFLKDIQFLLIGPAWIMSFLFKKIGLSV